MLEQTLHSNGNNAFTDYTFSAREWSAPTMIDIAEITDRVNSFNLVGRKIKDIRFVGHCYNLTRNWIEEIAYSSLETMAEEERQRQSQYANISPEMQYSRFAEIDEPLLIMLENESDSDDSFRISDTFEVDTPQEPEFRLSMNCIPWGIDAGTNIKNADAKLLFAPCIGHYIKDVKVNTYSTDLEPMFHEPFDSEHSKRDFVSDITIWLDNEIGICIEGFIDFCHVCCIDKSGETLTLPFSELKEALFNWEDLNVDQVTGVESHTSTLFFNKKGAGHVDEPFMTLSSSGSDSVLNISVEDFCLFDWCISDLFEWFDEYDDYKYTYEQWNSILNEAEKILSFESFDMLFDYRLSLYNGNENNNNNSENYFLRQMNCDGADFWKNHWKYKKQLAEMKAWTELVMHKADTMSIIGF